MIYCALGMAERIGGLHPGQQYAIVDLTPECQHEAWEHYAVHEAGHAVAVTHLPSFTLSQVLMLSGNYQTTFACRGGEGSFAFGQCANRHPKEGLVQAVAGPLAEYAVLNCGSRSNVRRHIATWQEHSGKDYHSQPRRLADLYVQVREWKEEIVDVASRLERLDYYSPGMIGL